MIEKAEEKKEAISITP
jgi:hypothetical protein